MGIVFQDSGVVPCLTIDENLSFAQGLSGATADSDANSSLLAQLNMSEYGASLPHELSGGQRQRAAIATAMSKSPNSFSQTNRRVHWMRTTHIQCCDICIITL